MIFKIFKIKLIYYKLKTIIMNKNDFFENTLINTGVYHLVLDYLSLIDIKNLISLNKNFLYKKHVL